MAIVDVQRTRSGLPAIRDVTCMQINALEELSAVIMRLRCRKKVSMRLGTWQDKTAQA